MARTGRPKLVTETASRSFLTPKVSRIRSEEIDALKACLESKNLLPKYKEIARAKLAILEGTDNEN